MANKNIFKTNPGNVKNADAVNEAGGKAYALSDKAALAQYALTGTFNGTFYASDQEQLNKVIELANKCNVEYVARLAVYAREKGLMKDSPAVLTAIVATKNTELFKAIFPLTINDPKMLRNFVQIIRSGVVGRKSLGSAPKRFVQNFLNGLPDEQLFRADVGNDPSLQDIIKMVHPKANSPERNALYGYLIDKPHNVEVLLPLARHYEAFKRDMSFDIPNVPFQMLTALPLTDEHWKAIARRATWNQARMNLNTFARHGVLKDNEIVHILAQKLQNPDEIRRSRTFPYQLFAAFKNVDDSVPMEIKIALQAAGEVAIENVPEIEGRVAVCLDVSGSMKSPVTGKRGTATTKMRCVDVAALFAAAILRKNRLATVIPFDTQIKNVNINPMDSVMTNAEKLAVTGGGTDCGVALALLNERNAQADLVVYVSDNQSWVQSNKTFAGETSMMREWSKFQNKNKNARLVNIDINPYGSTQVYDQGNVLNIGGFSDQVFEVVSMFAKEGNNDTLMRTIDGINLGE